MENALIVNLEHYLQVFKILQYLNTVLKYYSLKKISLEVKFAQNSPPLKNGLLGVLTSFTVWSFARNNLLWLTISQCNFLLFALKKIYEIEVNEITMLILIELLISINSN